MSVASKAAAKSGIPFKGKILAAYDRSVDNLPNILLVGGSLLDFRTTAKINDSTGCIVNAANESCLGGGGVDGAITSAGGEKLVHDRLNLPILQLEKDDGNDAKIDAITRKRTTRKFIDIRCHTGSAVITGPADYNKLHVPYVIHAVGPDFNRYAISSNPQVLQHGYDLLGSAYQKSLHLATATNTNTIPITHIAFCLLSAGIFRGKEPLEQIVHCGLSAISDWRPRSIGPVLVSKSATRIKTELQNELLHLKEIHVFAYTERECEVLAQCGELIFSRNSK